MADKITSTKSAQERKAEEQEKANKEINDALDTARDAMIKAGMPPDQADAMLNAARPSGGGGVVGNYADLQRMGAIAQTGTMPTPPAEEDLETSDLTDAFTEGPQAGKGIPNPDEDRFAFAHTLPEVSDAQKAADERHAEEGTAAPAEAPAKAEPKAAPKAEATTQKDDNK